MKAFLLKVISFFRTFIGTMRKLRNSLNVRLEVDSNHDGKPDITVEVSNDGVVNQTGNNSMTKEDFAHGQEAKPQQQE